jgi:hypothetical protein
MNHVAPWSACEMQGMLRSLSGLWDCCHKLVPRPCEGGVLRRAATIAEPEVGEASVAHDLGRRIGSSLLWPPVEWSGVLLMCDASTGH